MKRGRLAELGVPPHVLGEAAAVVQAAGPVLRRDLDARVAEVVADPAAHRDDPHLGALARLLEDAAATAFRERSAPAPWSSWGEDPGVDAIRQMANAVRLPVAVRGALMPDGHPGYGLPIGGVLAVEDAVIPYAVGVDIACRMRLSVLDLPVSALDAERGRLGDALEATTRFGVGAAFATPLDHPVMDADWGAGPVTKRLRDRAGSQLGTSGSGNHFAEFGLLTLEAPDLGLPAGLHVALLTHSGSRGAGAAVADHYTKVAMAAHPGMPDDLRHLAWLGLDTMAGQEYWAAMELMGAYAAANHELIHARVSAALGAPVRAAVENHHNFAWREEHEGREVIVHRKGATPAGEGVLGVIPGSMASPGFVVRGKGNPDALCSASHGAGRVMSRRAAQRTLDWDSVKAGLDRAGVTVLSAGLDECPDVYRDIHGVMAAQRDLVDVVARFDPRIVKMAPPGERPED